MIKVRVDGQVMHLPTLKGADGKSAYQYAVEGGYQGTEQEFINLLIDGTDLIHSHLTDDEAHADIRKLLDEARESVNSYTIKKRDTASMNFQEGTKTTEKLNSTTYYYDLLDKYNNVIATFTDTDVYYTYKEATTNKTGLFHYNDKAKLDKFDSIITETDTLDFGDLDEA